MRDMWLTGFDAPSLHTMYVDKPMRGHGLMQADRPRKPGVPGQARRPRGRLPRARARAQACARDLYRERRHRADRRSIKAEAVAVMLEKYEVCCGLFHGFDRSRWTRPGPHRERLALLPGGPGARPGSGRTARSVACRPCATVSRAFALAVPHDDALRIRDDVAFFQAVRAVLSKRAEAGEGAAGRRAGARRTPARLAGGGFGRV